MRRCWKRGTGNLARDGRFRGLDLPAMPMEVSSEDRAQPGPRPTVSGERVVLFLIHRQAEEGMPPPEVEWTGAGDSAKFSALWIEAGQVYELRQPDAKPPRLWPVTMPRQEATEKNLKQATLEILAARADLAEARAIADPARAGGIALRN